MAIPFWVGRYIGLPFSAHGRTRGGLDCWGLVRLVYAEEFNIALPSLAENYHSVWSLESIPDLIASESRHWRKITANQEKTGDVIVLRLRGHPLHVGLVVCPGRMLHIEESTNSALDPYTSTRWKERIHGFYRHNHFG